MRSEGTSSAYEQEARPRQRGRRGLSAFECGCFGDWTDEPAAKREGHARAAVQALVSTILETDGGVA